MQPTYMLPTPGLGIRMRCDRCRRPSRGHFGVTVEQLDAICTEAGWHVEKGAAPVHLCPSCSGFSVQQARVLGMLLAAVADRAMALEEP